MRNTLQNLNRHWLLPSVVGLIALAFTVSTLDSSGAVAQLGQGPGLTLDETFNVQMGVYQVRALREYGFALFHPSSLQEVFGIAEYNPDHPPLGRLLIGIAHELTFPQLQPEIPAGSVCVTCGRFAAAGGFALTIILIGGMTSRWYGRAAGFLASLSMVLMPRLFAHGHIAALETFVNLTYVATVLWVSDRWGSERFPTWRQILIGGLLFGLCLLTKIQAVLLPVPIGLWVFWRWRLRSVVPMLVFGLTGLTVFFAGWPWLWLDPVNHLAEYFGRAAERQTLYCWYLGHKWADADVPWHYAIVMFAVTVPIGLHALGILGVLGKRAEAGMENADRNDAAAHNGCRTPNSGLLLLNILWPLVFFALPGITTYDGSRLFLMVFPLWAILIGRGGGLAWAFLNRRWGAWRAAALLGIGLAAQSYGVIAMHPVQLSYYNLLVGGPGGAARLGFEATYWGDSVTRSFLQEVGRHARPSVVDVAPVLHPFQLEEWHDQWPAGHANVTFRPFNGMTGASRYVVVFRRRADSWDQLTPAPAGGRLISEVRRAGVQLAAMYELPQDAPAEPPAVDEAEE